MPGQGEEAGRTVIYRDNFGVPHIYAPTVEAGLYAQGWAQAEDRPMQLLMNLKIALGEFTELAGEGGVQTSLIARMFGHMRNAAISVADMTETERNRLIAFANGITDFYQAHPEDVPPWWNHPAITPEMIDAFGRMFLYNWSIDEGLGRFAPRRRQPGFHCHPTRFESMGGESITHSQRSRHPADRPASGVVRREPLLGNAHPCRRTAWQRRGPAGSSLYRPGAQ